ncbi:MAG: DUF2860 family protein [Gammaproteobacteria bacterium]|nr:DUF2860 family protein [Gammaproteobacteria bacterium]
MKISKSLVATSISMAILLPMGSAMAADPMQKEAGWSGRVLVGAGYMELENSEVAGTKIVDLENKQINNFSSPSNESTAIPVLNVLVRYTLDDKTTEFFAGNTMEDYLNLDSAIALGVRHEFNGVGIMGVRTIVSASPTDVYEDPLLTGANRKKTDRTTAGIGLKWEKIMASSFDLDLTARNLNVDKDRNGQSLVGTTITQAQQNTLERDGTISTAQVLYTFDINKANRLIPAVMFINTNTDGSARDNTAYELELTHVYMNGHWLAKTSVSGGASSFDNKNPVFDEKQDTTFLTAGSNITYMQPYGWKDWGISGGLLFSAGNSDIKFYDTQIFVAHVGMMYMF